MRQGKFEKKNDASQPVSGDTVNAPETQPDRAEASARNILVYLHDIACLLCVVLVLFLLVFRVAVVSGSSMYNTLVDGDYLLLLGNVFYTTPKRGDIVVISKASFDNGMPIIKRIIATEGQQVDIDFEAGIVYVDGQALEEPYTFTPTNQGEGVEFPLTVEDGCVFVLGDNRNISKDSRNPEIGLIDTREILGKAIFLFMPGTDGGSLPQQFYRIGALN